VRLPAGRAGAHRRGQRAREPNGPYPPPGVLYGLLGPASERHGLPIGGEPGMLVAFRSDVLQEVRPVTRGERQTVVSWYL
jgi:hypothetical protein